MRYSNLRYLLFAAVTAVTLSLFLTACGKSPAKGEPIMPRDGVFTIDASAIDKGGLKFFRYDVGRKSVVFMVAKTKTGEIKTAFDACITCYPHMKGYRFESGRVVCVYCGTPFEFDELGRGKGNCIPIQIEHNLDGSTILIEKSIIESGARWF